MFFTSVSGGISPRPGLSDTATLELVLHLPIQLCQRRSLRCEDQSSQQYSILPEPDCRRWHIRLLLGH